MILNHVLDIMNFVLFWIVSNSTDSTLQSISTIWIYMHLISIGPMVGIGAIFAVFWFTFAMIHDLLSNGTYKKKCSLSKLCLLCPIVIIGAILIGSSLFFITISSFGWISVFITAEITNKYSKGNDQYQFLSKLLSFMHGGAVTNDLSRPYIARYHYSGKEKQDDERLRLLTVAKRYKNDDVIRALSVNHGYFTKSEVNPRYQKDMILSDYIHSIDTDIFRLKIQDLRTHTKIAGNMDFESGANIFVAYFKLLYFRQYAQYKRDYDQYWTQNKEKRGCTDWIEYGLPFVYCWMFVYIFLPLYMVSRFINVSLPVLVLVMGLNADVSSAEMVVSVINIILTIILGIILCTKIRKIYLILIFNVAFGVLDIQFATGYDGSAYYALKYILNYYEFGKLIQIIKPMLIDHFGNDIASIIMHYWLSFDDVALRNEQTPLEELVMY